MLASGPASSLYHEHAQRYQEALRRHGVRLVERMTEGAGENLRLLGDKASGVDIAFVQAVSAPPQGRIGIVVLRRLAALYQQPAKTIAAALFPLRRPSPYDL